MELSGGAEGRICESPVGRRQTHRTVWSGDNGGEDMPYPETEHMGLGSRKRPQLLSLSFFLYLFAVLWRQVREAAGGPGRSSLGWGLQFLRCWRPPGSLQWLQCSPSVWGPLPALLLCPQRPARKKKKKVCSQCKEQPAGCQSSSTCRRCFLHRESQVVWKGQSEERLKKIQCLWVKGHVSPQRLTHEITEEQFTVSKEWARERERYA